MYGQRIPKTVEGISIKMIIIANITEKTAPIIPYTAVTYFQF